MHPYMYPIRASKARIRNIYALSVVCRDALLKKTLHARERVAIPGQPAMPARKSAAGDCAHYCLPGPIDEWVRLLLALWA